MEQVDELITRARAAQRRFEAGAEQARYDRAALAAAWALMEPARNRALSELAVRTTGLGNVADKITKNHRKTLGLLRDLSAVRTCGVIADHAASGISEIARPVGVVGAVVPSTNPVATPTNNLVNALKCGNAIILAPSPKGSEVCAALLGHIHGEFARAGIDPDLVQMLPAPPDKAKTQRLMEQVDLSIVTGSRDNVRRAHASGRPAIGVGVGNAAVIVDESADLTAAAEKIAASKCFDNATSCSSENGLLVVDAVYDRFMAALQAAGGQIADPPMKEKFVAALWRDGGLNRHMIASDYPVMMAQAGLTPAPGARFLALEAEGVGPGEPLSGEKLSLALGVWRVADFAAARELAGRILHYQGAGHSVGLHSQIDERAMQLGRELPTCRVIVNQAHSFAVGGSFDNGMPFSLSMGCGSWGGNIIDTNLHWRHFMNVTRVIRTIPDRQPELEAIFGPYWQAVGK